MSTSTIYNNTNENTGWKLSAFSGRLNESADTSSLSVLDQVDCSMLLRLGKVDQAKTAIQCQELKNSFLEARLSELKGKAKELSTVPITSENKKFQQLVSDATALNQVMQRESKLVENFWSGSYPCMNTGYDAWKPAGDNTQKMAKEMSHFIGLLKGE